jgi:hypothetical protein
VNWYRRSKDPTREMLKLSTYLGHTDPAHTYWYLKAFWFSVKWKIGASPGSVATSEA